MQSKGTGSLENTKELKQSKAVGNPRGISNYSVEKIGTKEEVVVAKVVKSR